MLANAFKNVLKFKNVFMNNNLIQQPFNQLQITQNRNIIYRSNELWKSVLLVSNQGSKKGRSKRRGAAKAKDLNAGQNLGDGKLQVVWPGLNSDIIDKKNVQQIKVIGEDIDREKKLTEIRNKMDKFRTITIPPHERGFTGSSLNGKSLGAPLSYDDVDFSGFDTIIVRYKAMLAHKSILGKKKTISCFAVTGNREGVIGYGSGKGPTASGALKLAKAHASQRLLNIDLYENRTLFHDFYEEYYHTKIYAEKKPKGYGLVCHRLIKKICQLLGVKDIYVKVEGSHNEVNITKAFLSGLLNQKKYADIANAKDLFLVEYKPENNYYPNVLASPEKNKNSEKNTDKSQNLNENEEKYENEYLRDFNLFLFDNRFRAEKKKKLPFYYHDPAYKQYCKLRDKHNLLKKARIERIKLLPDEVLNQTKYPMRPKPKQQEEASNE